MVLSMDPSDGSGCGHVPRAAAARAVIHPSEIIATAQRGLTENCTEADVWQLIDLAREALHAYFSHRSSASVDSPLMADPLKYQMIIERMLMGIVLGVMTRSAIFEAIGRLLEFGSAPKSNHVDYTTVYVGAYSDFDGQHQFMQSMVRELDAGVYRYYKRPIASVYRRVLRDLFRAVGEAEERYGKPLPNGLKPPQQLPIDPWTTEADLLFACDVRDVRERVRHTLRHNAETAMLFIRVFPGSVLQGFERSGQCQADLTLLQLQTTFLEALPTLLISATRRLKNGIPENAMARQEDPIQFEELLCDVAGETFRLYWRDRHLARPRKGGRCPAASPMRGLSPQQQRVISVLRSADAGRLTAVPMEDGTMSTAEALLRLALFMAPEMWLHQYEAHQICAELREPVAVRSYLECGIEHWRACAT
jgi:hypothetical protein